MVTSVVSIDQARCACHKLCSAWAWSPARPCRYALASSTCISRPNFCRLASSRTRAWSARPLLARLATAYGSAGAVTARAESQGGVGRRQRREGLGSAGEAGAFERGVAFNPVPVKRVAVFFRQAEQALPPPALLERDR